MLLVASSGGHLAELHQIASRIAVEDRRWVCFRQSNGVDVLQGEEVTWAHFPTNRSIKNLLRNLVLAVRDIRREPPRAMVSTGSGVAVPYAIICWACRIPVVFIESMARINSPSMSARLVYPFATTFFVQWPEMLEHFPKAKYAGAAFDLVDAGN